MFGTNQAHRMGEIYEWLPPFFQPPTAVEERVAEGGPKVGKGNLSNSLMTCLFLCAGWFPHHLSASPMCASPQCSS